MIKDGTLVTVDTADDYAVLATQVKLLPPAATTTSTCTDAPRSLSVTADATTLPDLTGANDINSLITHTFAQLTDGTYTFVSESPCMIEGVRQEVLENGVDVCAP